MSGQQAFFEALFDPERPPPAGLATWNGSDPAARFAVYRNNVIVSLIDALADTFPATQELVGETFFRALARLYVREEPPRSRMLAFYGESFPAFIERFPPAASVPYLADVARLEMRWVQAYHAADTAPLPADAIAQALARPDELAGLCIEFRPPVQLLRSRYAVLSLWEAHRGLRNIATVDPYAPECALILRPALDVEVIRLNGATGDFVARLAQGETLGVAFEAISGTHADFDLTDTLSLLIRTQAIATLHTN